MITYIVRLDDYEEWNMNKKRKSKELFLVNSLIQQIANFEPDKSSFLSLVLELLCIISDRMDKTIIQIPSALDAVKFRMEQGNLRQSDLVKYFGTKSHVSEFLSGKRELSKNVIVKLNKGLGIPLESLMK